MQQPGENLPVLRAAIHRKPLQLVLVAAGMKPDQLSYSIEDVSQRIREVKFAQWRQPVASAVEENGGSEVAGAIQAQDLRVREWGGEIRGSGVCGVMLDYNNLAVRKPGPKLKL